jgi:D-sedoheptulose 7-phosphate isomerase
MQGDTIRMDLKSTVRDSIAVKERLMNDEQLLSKIAEVIELVNAAFRRGNRIVFAGNGGSAADAQHLAAEFVSRFEFDRPGLPSISLATDTSMLTAIGNDYGYEMLFARQLRAQAREGDVFVGITTSGKSPNILEAFAACNDLGVASVALCGTRGDGLEERVDHIIRVPSDHTARVQECHILIGHMICGQAEISLFSHLAPQP